MNIRIPKTAGTLDPQEIVKAYQQCMSGFVIFHVLNHVIWFQAEKCFDIIEDNHLDKHIVKKSMGECRKAWNRYSRTLKTNMIPDAWYLLQDYALTAYDAMEVRLDHLWVAISNKINREKNQKNVRLLANCLTIDVLWQILCDTWKVFFRSFKVSCGVDFEPDFRYADLTPLYVSFVKIIDELSKGNVQVNFSTDDACMAAWRALRNTIDSEDFFDRAALTAIGYSKVYSEKYADLLAKSDERKQEMSVTDAAEKLAQKYKVTKL